MSFSICLVLLISLLVLPQNSHYFAEAHNFDDDDWFGRIDSSTPTPTSGPSLQPSLSPSFVAQTFQFNAIMTFNEFRDEKLDNEAKQSFERVCANFMTASLNSQRDGLDEQDDFKVRASIKNHEISNILSKNTNVRRRKLPSLHQQHRRQIQEKDSTNDVNAGISILVNLFVTVRSETNPYSTKNLIDYMKSIFSKDGMKEAFIIQLQNFDNETFYPISLMTEYTFSENELSLTSPTVLDAQKPSEKVGKQNNSSFMISVVCSSIFLIIILLVSLIVYRTRQRPSNGSVQGNSSGSDLLSCLDYIPIVPFEVFETHPNHGIESNNRIPPEMMDCRNCDDSTCTPPSEGSYSNNGSPFRSASMRSQSNDVDTTASLIFPLSLIISESSSMEQSYELDYSTSSNNTMC